jgi:hypothetical protein
MDDDPNDPPSHPAKPAPAPPAGNGKRGEPTAVRLTQCPNCGRKGAAVFPLVQPDKPDATVRLVCPDCCRKPRGNP